MSMFDMWVWNVGVVVEDCWRVKLGRLMFLCRYV